MKLKDLSIRKKITFTNFMMVVIPVLIVLLLTIAALAGLFAGAGSGLTIAAIDKLSGETVTNYQLQLMVDAIGEDLTENPNALEAGSALRTVCADLEALGAWVMIDEEGQSRYLSPGAAERQMREGEDAPAFVRTQDGFFYRGQTQTPHGLFTLTVKSDTLPYAPGEAAAMEHMKAQLKMVLLTVCAGAVVIIILVGIILSRRLSRRILEPVNRLREATEAVRNGDLTRPVGYSSRDELGRACAEFDEMRERLKASVQAQQHYEKQRQEMIVGISHDLSTPITSIKGYVSGLLDGIADTPEKRAHYLHTIYDIACGMERMADDLNLFSKLSAEGVSNKRECVELGGYLENACKELRLWMQKNGMELVFENRCAGPVFVDADRMEMDRVLRNLAENSIKYQKMDERVRGRVNVVLDRVKGGVRIVFSDNGMGIAEGEEEKIFETFYRSDPARSKRGSGIGLSIVRRIVARMGGKISAQGRPGLGLALTILLPEREGE